MEGGLAKDGARQDIYSLQDVEKGQWSLSENIYIYISTEPKIFQLIDLNGLEACLVKTHRQTDLQTSQLINWIAYLQVDKKVVMWYKSVC